MKTLPTRKTSSKTGKPRSQFLNVDLDIYSRSPLEPLVRALGQKVSPLYVGRELRLYSAHLEIAGYPKNADAAIRGLAVAVERLPREKRKVWDAARTRDFNVGVQAGARDQPFEIELQSRTVSMVASLNARIVFTIYAPNLLTGRPRRVSRSRSSVS
jgi:hypothetical protein